jgi:RNA polymerase sigma-70 factor, ECF subfamily
MVTETLDELFRAAQAGNARAYREFLSQVALWLRRFLARRLPAAEVEEVVQETLISLHKARHTWDGTRPALPWIASIARYRLTDHLRRHYAQSKHIEVDIDDFHEILPDESADVTETRIAYESLYREIESLPEKQRKILHLMYAEGYTAREAGTQLGMKESAVKVAAHRAYKVIRARIKDTA